MKTSTLFKTKTPIVPIRAVHLDLKGTPPTARRLVDLLKVFKVARYNAILVEWEDTFPWTVDQRFRSPTAYTEDEVRRFDQAARELGIELIPLVQCLGHMETPLSVPGYEHLREIPNEAAGLNPLAPGARDLVQRMVDNVLALMPDVKHFHLGGDEAWTFGSHPDTKAYVSKHGADALYLLHVGPILESLNKRGIRPMLWHDMMIKWSAAKLKALAQQADLVVWGYKGHPDTTVHHFNSKYIERFRKNGVPMWGGTAYKGADGHFVDRPVLETRQVNALAWAEVGKRYRMKGLIATAWSRYNTDVMQCEPIDAALDLLVLVGVILHDGKMPAGGLDSCVALLGKIGERKRFEACKTAMEHLTSIRNRCWRLVLTAREQWTLQQRDARRRHSNVYSKNVDRLRKAVQDADVVEAEVKKSLAGLMEPVWVNEYVAVRLQPFRDELAALEKNLQ